MWGAVKSAFPGTGIGRCSNFVSLSYGSSANLLHQSRSRGVSPMIWRRLRLQGNTSLAGLHHIIQIAMGWDDEYLHYFHI